jgi:hypothetical protein
VLLKGEGEKDVDLREVSVGFGRFALEGAPRTSYIGRGPWATSQFPSILVGYNMKGLSELS